MKINSKEFLLLNVGTVLTIIGVYFFKFPNNFSTGGVTGIAIIVAHFLPGVSTSTFTTIANMLLLIVGFIFIGKGFSAKTVYASLLLSAGLTLLEYFCPMTGPLTNEPLLELIFAVGLPGFGSALLFNIEASTGGTDIVAMLMKKYTSMNIGRALFICDILVVVTATFVFGIQTGLFSMLGLLIKSLMIDSVIESINQHKYLHIICSDPEPICDYIVKTLHRGATVTEAVGVYTHQHKYIIYTAMNRPQAINLRRFVRQVEPHAFTLITNTSEIIGKGFHSTT